MSELNTTKFTILARREAKLRELNGRAHSPLNRKNRKLLRSDIREIYFFGRKCTKDEINRLKWR